jgi:hypothetical protein
MVTRLWRCGQVLATRTDRNKIDREYRSLFHSGPPPILQILLNIASDDPEDAWRLCEEAIRTGVKPVGPTPDDLDI